MLNDAHNVDLYQIDELTPDEQLAAISADLSVALIHDVVIAAYDPHVNSFSNYAPLGSKGTELQMRVTEFLRDRLCGAGWEMSNLEQVACVFNREDNVRIVCSTDGGSSVGIDYPARPLLRAKGKGTIRLAGHRGNGTLPIPGLEAFLQNDELRKLDGLDFYYLLMHIDEAREEIRVELSSPIFDDKGVMLRWRRRIILPSISTSAEPSVDARSVPAPEIAVMRKPS